MSGGIRYYCDIRDGNVGGLCDFIIGIWVRVL